MFKSTYQSAKYQQAKKSSRPLSVLFMMGVLTLGSYTSTALATDTATLTNFLTANNYTLTPTTTVEGNVNASASALANVAGANETVSIINGPGGKKLVIFLNQAGEVVSALESNTDNDNSGSGSGSSGGSNNQVTDTEATQGAIADASTTRFIGNGFANNPALTIFSPNIGAVKEKFGLEKRQEIIREARRLRALIKPLEERLPGLNEIIAKEQKILDENRAGFEEHTQFQDTAKFLSTDRDVRIAIEERTQANHDAFLRAKHRLEPVAREANRIDFDVRQLKRELAPLEEKIKEFREGTLRSKSFDNITVAQANNNQTLSGNYRVVNSTNGQPWIITFGLGHSQQNDDRDNAGIKSTMNDFTVGFETLLDDLTSVGFSGGIRQGDVESDNNNSKQEGDYFSFAANISRQLDNDLMIGGAISISKGDNDIEVNGNTGSFDVNVVTLSGSVSGNTEWNDYDLTPKLAVAISQIKRDAYTDSAANNVPSSKMKQQQVTVGATLSREYFETESFKRLTPSYGAEIGYFRQDDLSASLPNGADSEELGLGVNFHVGVNMVMQNDLTANIKTQYGVFNGNVSSWSISGNISYEF